MLLWLVACAFTHRIVHVSYEWLIRRPSQEVQWVTHHPLLIRAQYILQHSIWLSGCVHGQDTGDNEPVQVSPNLRKSCLLRFCVGCRLASSVPSGPTT